MQRMIKNLLLSVAVMLPTTSFAQLSSNPDKFLGNITTGWTNMDYTYNGTTFKFSDYWDQTTPENGSKWSIVEGTRGSYNWWNTDVAFNYAQQHHFPYKFHTLVWGSQFPDWVRNLSATERYQAIVEWMDAVKSHYPNLEMIDVVNEAIDGHQGETYLMKEALGGGGETGYDWIIKAFEMAAERWPNAILIYNDFNTFQWDTDKYIDLVKTLRNAGAPIDAYGCQSHDLGGVSGSAFGPVMKRIHDELQMPMYITEYDIGDNNDGNQKWNYMEHFPLMWEADYCAGVTLWGWIYGQTWTGKEADGTKGNSGLIKDGVERSALKWLREYMQTDKAKSAKSPFPGMKKEASVYIKPASLRGELNTPMTVDINARMISKSIDHIDFYVNGSHYQTLTAKPYSISYTPTDAGEYSLKAVVTTTDGAQYERLSSFTVNAPMGVAKRFTSLNEIGSTPFAIVNEQEGKAFYGINDQNLGYDVFSTVFVPNVSGYLFKLEKCSDVANGYFLRLITPDGQPYSPWGGYAPGYLNSQLETGNCCFLLGNSESNPNGKHNGQDLENGAVWVMEYVAGKGFSLKNVGTGKYLKTNDAAKYDSPTYFTFCTLGAVTGVEAIKREPLPTNRYFTLDGRMLNGKPSRPGIYIVGGKKVVIK